jgi:hypothetical protein
MNPMMFSSAASTLYPWVQDSNFSRPRVGPFPNMNPAAERARMGNPLQRAAGQFPMPDDERLKSAFAAFEPGAPAAPQGRDQGLITKFANLLHSRADAAASAPAAPPNAPPAAPAPPPAPEAAPMPQSRPGGAPEADTTHLYGGSPETNALLRPMGTPLPWQGSPFAGLLNAGYERGMSSDAGLIPKMIHAYGRAFS